jgi:hypothetical protein
LPDRQHLDVVAHEAAERTSSGVHTIASPRTLKLVLTQQRVAGELWKCAEQLMKESHGLDAAERGVSQSLLRSDQSTWTGSVSLVAPSDEDGSLNLHDKIGFVSPNSGDIGLLSYIKSCQVDR